MTMKRKSFSEDGREQYEMKEWTRQNEQKK